MPNRHSPPTPTPPPAPNDGDDSDGSIESITSKKSSGDFSDELVAIPRRRRSGSVASDGDEDEDEDDGHDAPEDEHLLGRHDSNDRRPPLADDLSAADETARRLDGEPLVLPGKVARPQPVSWSSLPKKGQLAVLTLARLSEPLSQTSLQSYMFYQLKSFGHGSDGRPPSDATVARQVGLLAASFTGAQFLTAMMWGRISDSKNMGRKRVILIGLLGTAAGSLGFGFSTSFASAITWRFFAGVLNGNVGVMRTMISEMVREKKYQSRAFLLLPMTFNIGVLIGPLLGGLLADPASRYPGLFGPSGVFGDDSGFGWLVRTWPYALPNMVNTTFLVSSAMGVIFGLEETLEERRHLPDHGIRLRKWIARRILGWKDSAQGYRGVRDGADDVELVASPVTRHSENTKLRARLPIRRMYTRNVLTTLLCHALLASHVGTFSSLWFLFLSTPRYDPAGSNETLALPARYHLRLPFIFTGGLALPPPSIGTALAIMGAIGISLQLLLYPRLSFRLGTLKSYRYATLVFPFAYTLAPFLAILPSSAKPPSPASGMVLWLGITGVLLVQVMARTFALPSMTILVNNASPHPSVLGSMHGLAQSVSSAARTGGPAFMGWLYGVGLTSGMVGLAWWCMAGIAVIGAIAGRFVREGNGHEILLEGEVDEDGT